MNQDIACYQIGYADHLRIFEGARCNALVVEHSFDHILMIQVQNDVKTYTLLLEDIAVMAERAIDDGLQRIPEEGLREREATEIEKLARMVALIRGHNHLGASYSVMSAVGETAKERVLSVFAQLYGDPEAQTG